MAGKSRVSWALEVRDNARTLKAPFFWKGFEAHDSQGNRLMKMKKDESPMLDGVACNARPKWRA